MHPCMGQTITDNTTYISPMTGLTYCWQINLTEVGKMLMTLVLITSAVTVGSVPWEACDILTSQRCTCWDPQHPAVHCTHLNLTSLPDLSTANSVVEMDFSHNQLTDIPSNAFRGIPIERLDLSYNPDLELEAESLSGLETTLKSLDLSHTSMRLQPPDIFNGMVNIEELDLSHNQLVRVGNLKPLVKLKRLHLIGNDIYSYGSGSNAVFAETASLNELDIQLQNYAKTDCLRSIQRMGAHATMNLKVLRIRGCKAKFYSSSVWHFTSLQLLSMQNCSINQHDVGDSEIFEGISNTLLALDLSHNNLVQFPSALLQPLQHLQILELSHNLISRLPASSFPSTDTPVLATLKELYLTNNGIQNVPARTFDRFQNLQIVDLSNNLIQILPESLASLNLEGLWITGNPIKCTCSAKWLVQLAGQEYHQGQPGPLRLHDITGGVSCRGRYHLDKSLQEAYEDRDFWSQC